jgi:hypothetical protein
MAAIDGSALGSSVAQQEALLGAAQGGTAGTTGWGAAAPVAGGGGLTTAGILGGTAGGAGTAGAGFATPTLGGAAAGTGAALGGIGSALASNPALVGAALGGLAGAAGGGDATSTASRDLPAWLQPYAQSYLGRADALSQRPFEAYSGQRVANLSPDQQTAMTQVRDLATVGNPLVNQAQGQQSNVIGGGMLNANPYIDQVAKNIGDRMGEAYATGTRANLASSANMAGGGGQRFNSAAQQVMGNADRSFGDALGSTMSNLYMGNYQNERAAQDAAARGSLNFGNFGRQNTEGLLNVGGPRAGHDAEHPERELRRVAAAARLARAEPRHPGRRDQPRLRADDDADRPRLEYVGAGARRRARRRGHRALALWRAEQFALWEYAASVADVRRQSRLDAELPDARYVGVTRWDFSIRNWTR